MSQEPQADHRVEAEEAGSRRSLWLLLSLLALAVLGVVIWLVMSPDAVDEATTDDPTEETTEVDVVTQFSGSADDTTDSFEVAGNWQIEWETSGETFEVELFTDDGETRGVIVTSDGEAEGGTFVTEGGDFYLEVTANDDWSVEIFDGGGG